MDIFREPPMFSVGFPCFIVRLSFILLSQRVIWPTGVVFAAGVLFG